MPLTEPHDDSLPQEESVDAARHPGEEAPAARGSAAPEPTTAAGFGPGAAPTTADPVAEPEPGAESEPEPHSESEPEPEPEPMLPEPVRQRIVALTAAVLPVLPGDEVPVPLRRVAKFAPNRRARLGAPMIATQLTADPLFRQRITARVLADSGDLGAAVVAGTAPAAADPVEVAALAYLARPRGWRALIDVSGAAVRAEADRAVVDELVREAEQRATRAEHDRAVARVEADKLRDELARVRDELGQLREENRQLARTLREAQARERRAAELLATERGRATRAATEADAELRRARARLAEAEAAAGVARASAKEARSVDDAKLWLLLETIGQAAVGLRRELALDPVDRFPADFVADAFADQPNAAPAGAATRARDTDDPARLDQLLALPKAHLVVDGYNVTKRGFGEMSLEQQRKRLITGLGGIAAQTGDEVTVVFDGAERMHGLPPTPRGVRVLFSRKGETADELIRRLVRAEPAGRPVVVVSSDREVADGVRRHGAYPLGADSLLRRLARS
ncbi:NYN domain-containing protein [Micromonospora carbonacea]|uniref:NYN domain-containing protein n=1 Tax=Micromonospora carbonacea TaxID=47853 RepID=UPI003714C2C6